MLNDMSRSRNISSQRERSPLELKYREDNFLKVRELTGLQQYFHKYRRLDNSAGWVKWWVYILRFEEFGESLKQTCG